MPIRFLPFRIEILLLLGGSSIFCLGIAAEPADNTHSGKSSEKLHELPTNRFRPVEMFDLETATDPQISPDGSRIVFVRNFSDIMKDRHRSNLWLIDYDGSDLRPLTTGNQNDSSPRWSPDGKRLVYVSTSDGSA